MNNKLTEGCDHVVTAMYETHDGALMNRCTSCPSSYTLTDEEATEYRRSMEENDDKN